MFINDNLHFRKQFSGFDSLFLNFLDPMVSKSNFFLQSAFELYTALISTLALGLAKFNKISTAQRE